MRNVIAVAIIAALTVGQAMAQPSNEPRRGSNARRTAETPLDRGPFTPEANRAYQGGGMILEGAPGAPAPMPEATPPGQMPRNMVPPR